MKKRKLKKQDLLPDRLSLVGWEEERDLRRLRREAQEVAEGYRLKVGEAVLVSGSFYGGARRFALVVQAGSGAMVVQPQTGKQDLLLSLMVRVSEFIMERQGTNKK